MAGTCWCMDHSHTALDAAIPVAADDHPTHPFQICHTHDPQIAQTHELATESRQATNLQIAAWNSRSICRDPLERMYDREFLADPKARRSRLGLRATQSKGVADLCHWWWREEKMVRVGAGACTRTPLLPFVGKKGSP